MVDTITELTIPSGVYIVPDEIAPGTYRFVGCVARPEETQEIIDNDLSDGQLIVIVNPSDWVLQYTGDVEPLPCGRVGSEAT